MKQMHKLLLPVTVFLLFTGQVFAQDFKLPKKRVRCYTDEYLQDLRTKNPSVMSNLDFESWLQPLIYQHKKTINAAPQNGAPTAYKLPIVFHIIYNGEAIGDTSNVGQDMINEEVLQLNKDYANLSNSQYAVAANSGIQFGLAAVDPSGNTLVEPGIDRQNIKTRGWTSYGPPFNDAGSSTGNFWTKIKAATIWDPTKYVNVWVADIASGTSGIVGISTFPTSSTLQGLTPATETVKNAGIVVDFTTIGSVYSPNTNGNTTCGQNVYALGKSATHELGHFFGLRHIWGDGGTTGACATDYCNDTPTADVANYGTPTHPKSNVCGTTDEMFEDYMDYSDDHIMSTFTQNQVDRMQTVMKNSPWRKTLNNAVAMVDVVGTNEISFTECSGAITVAETGTTGTYPRYHDMSVMLNVDNAATDTTSVVSVTATGTAVAGVDYQIMNPDISFATGDKYKAIQLRIFDNNLIDGDRYLFLNYTISGTGLVAGANTQSLKINIMDDDNIKIGQNRTSLISQNFGTTGGALPTGWYAGGSSTTNSFVVGSTASAGMTGQFAYVTNNKTSKPLTYTKGTAASSYLYFLINGFSLMSLDTFSFTYKVGGVADGTTAYGDYAWTLYTGLHDTLPGLAYFGTVGDGTGATTNTGFGPYLKQTTAKRMSLIPTADMQRNKLLTLFYFETGTQTTGTNPGFEVDSVVLRGMPYKVETALCTGYGYDIPSLSYNVFRSPNNKAMLIFKDGPTAMTNLSASILDAGTTQVSFTTAAGSYNRAKKVYKLASSAVDNASLDSIIFYYTTAELSVWGAKIPNLKVLQVNDGVSFTAPLNSGNAVLLTPIVDTTKFKTDSVYTFKVYTKGLGTFMLVDPNTALPLNMISFKGSLRENIAGLTWSTSNEFNTSGFDVERSTDGEHYTTLGWVNSVGKDAVNNYSYNDKSIVKGNKYYYRLKQVDKDGKFTYSSVVIIAYLGGDNWVNIYPNPVKNNLYIQKQNGSNTNTSIVITDASGKVVYQNISSLSTTLDIETSTWSRGVYFVKVNSNEGSSTVKIVKD